MWKGWEENQVRKGGLGILGKTKGMGRGTSPIQTSLNHSEFFLLLVFLYFPHYLGAAPGSF